MDKELQKLQTEFQQLAVAMANAQRASQHPDNLDVYRNQMKKVNDLRKGYTNAAGQYVAGFNEMSMATGRYGVETVKTISATERLTKSISDQKLTMGQAYRSLGTFKEAWREQVALQKAFGVQWTGNMMGKNQTDLYVPKNLGDDLDNARVKYGYINQAIGAIGTQTVNWGKNTQWAGRQIMVGLGVPIAIAAAGMAKLAYDADVQLTRLSRVYDTTTNEMLSADDQAIAKQNELQQLRANSMMDARRLASQYGQSVTDTLTLEADLAATGQKGMQLRQSTAEVTRISTLGELDHATALEMTTALMSTYNMGAKELTETFNYMNQIENSTSLATKDFAEGIPRAASAMKSLGVDVKQMGILLVAMKAGGVDAAEGANAMKSATARLLKPTADAVALFDDMDISIKQVAHEAGGNLFKILSTIGPAMKDFAPQQRQAAMAALFGTYQFNRLNVATDGLTQALAGNVDETNQVKRAMDAAGMSVEELAATASAEMDQLQNSMSNRFKRAIETLKADFIQLGETLLPILTWGVEKVSALVKWFIDLPGPIKTVATALAAVGLAAGPIIMLLGLFANLFGNLLKMGSWFGNLVLRFKAMDKAQRAEELMARRAASAFDSEASSVAKLTMELQLMIQSMDQAASAQNNLTAALTASNPAAAGGTTGQTYVGGNGKKKGGRGPNAGLPAKPAAPDTSGMASAAAASNTAAVAQNAEKAKLSFGKIAGYMGAFGLGAFALHGMLDDSGGLTSNLMNAAMFAAMIASTGALGGAAKLAKSIGESFGKMGSPTAGIKAGWGKIASLFSSGWASTKGWVSTLRGGAGVMRNLIPMIATAFGPLGLLAVGATAIAAIGIHIENAKVRQDKINASTAFWAEQLGFVEQTWGNIQDAEGNSSKSNPYSKRQDMVDAMKEDQEELVGALEDAANASDNFASVYSLAMGEALKAKLKGADAAGAKEAFMVSLQAAGLDSATIKRLSIRFDTVDLDNASDVANQIATQIDDSLNTFETNDMGASWVREVWGDINPFGEGAPVISQAAEDAGERAGQQFALGLANAPTQDAQEAMAENLTEQMKSKFAGMFTDLASDSDISSAIKEAGINNMQDLYEAYQVAQTRMQKGQSLNPLQQALMESTDVGESIQSYEAVWDAMMGQVQATLGLTAGDMKKLKEAGFDVGAMMKIVGNVSGTMANSVSNSASAMAAASGQADNFANALRHINNQAKFAQLTGEQVVSGMKDAFSGAQGVVISQADKLWGRYVQGITDGQSRAADRTQKGLDARGKREDKYWDDRMQALEDAQDAEDKAFENHWDGLEKGYDDAIDREKDVADAKIETINAEIEALTEADDERQKLFDREKTRIDRMAQLHNNNVDFNAALNSGNLDEAAKIYSSNSSQTQQWSIEDQQASLAEQLEKRKKVLQDSIAAIEAERDRRIEALEQQKEAVRAQRQLEEEAHQRRQDIAKRDIETQREVAREKLQADQEYARQSAANSAASTQRIYEDKKTKLDMEIAAIKSTVPKTVEEYNNQVAQIEAKYQEYGVRLQDYGDSWGGIVGMALSTNVAGAAAGLQNDIAWNAIGQYIADQITAGTGVSISQLTTFLNTGKFPEKEVVGKATSWNPNLIYMGDGRYRNKAFGGMMTEHTGGIPSEDIGWSQKDRMGVPRSASPYPTEIPTLIKQGEYVINANASRTHRDLLDKINGGAQPETIARHSGGLAATPGIGAAGYGAMIAQATRVAMQIGMQRMQAAQAAQAMSGSGNPAGEAYVGSPGKVAPQPGRTQIDRMWNTVHKAFPGAKKNSDYRPGDPGYHGKGKAIDLGKAGVAGGQGNMYMAAINRWIHDNFPGSTELIYDGLGDDRPDLKNGRPLNYSRSTQQEHKNHVHWAMQAFHKGGMANMPSLRSGGAVKYDNTMTNLHKGETVLTKPLTDSMKSAIDSGLGSEYNVTIDLRGAYIHEDVDIEKAVDKAIEKREAKNGRKRVIK